VGYRKPTARDWPPLNLNVAAYVVKAAMTGADVELRFVGLEVLAVVIELHMAAGAASLVLFVVFDVIGTKTAVPIVNIHISVGGG